MQRVRIFLSASITLTTHLFIVLHVQYEYLDKTFRDHSLEQLCSWAFMVLILYLTYTTVVACFNGGAPVVGAVMISFWNGIIPEVVRVLVTVLESHHTFDEVEDSFLAKTVAGRWFTSSVVLYILGHGFSTQVWRMVDKLKVVHFGLKEGGAGRRSFISLYYPKKNHDIGW